MLPTVLCPVLLQGYSKYPCYTDLLRRLVGHFLLYLPGLFGLSNTPNTTVFVSCLLFILRTYPK